MTTGTNYLSRCDVYSCLFPFYCYICIWRAWRFLFCICCCKTRCVFHSSRNCLVTLVTGQRFIFLAILTVCLAKTKCHTCAFVPWSGTIIKGKKYHTHIKRHWRPKLILFMTFYAAISRKMITLLIPDCHVQMLRLKRFLPRAMVLF